MELIVCGGRDEFPSNLEVVLSRIHESKPISLIIHGGATGVDALAGEWGKRNGVDVEVYKADWGKNGKAAGPIRNALMLERHPNAGVMAFKGGRGTCNMIGLAFKASRKLMLDPEMNKCLAP